MKIFKPTQLKLIASGLIILVFLVLIVHCSGRHDPKERNIFIVKEKRETFKFYYSGTVEPITAVPITSPSDAIVTRLYFHYGDSVKKNQILIDLSSEKLLKDYRSALTQFVKAKSEDLDSQNSYKETEFLYQKQLVSLDERHSKQSTYYQAKLALAEAQATLNAVGKQMGRLPVDLNQLTLQNVGKVIEALQSSASDYKITIYAPGDGVVLMPYRQQSGTQIKALEPGSSVKEGDLLVMLGDMSGLFIRIQATEQSINEIQSGQTVSVTSNALPDLVLKGVVTGVDRQSAQNENGALIFPVDITVSHLTENEKKQIHIGEKMQIEIKIYSAPAIFIPIKTVIQKNVDNWVAVQDTKTGKEHLKQIKTGQVMGNYVEVLSGLQQGDTIITTASH